MKVQECNLTTGNITFLYDELNRDYISIDKIRKIRNEKPIMADLLGPIPGFLLIKYQEINVDAIADAKRIVVSTAIQNNDILSAAQLIASVGKGIYGAVEKGILLAYGFNYDGDIKTDIGDRSISLYFKDTFFQPLKNLEEFIHGELYSVSPSFTLSTKEYNLSLTLVPVDDFTDKFAFRFNAHFKTGQLLEEEELVQSIVHTFDDFKALIERI